MKALLYLTGAWLTSFFLLSSCTDNEIIPTENKPISTDTDILKEYYFVLNTDVTQTRVSYNNEKESYFDEGDEMGLFVIDNDGNLVSSGNGNPTTANVRYRVSNVTGLDGIIRQVIEPCEGPTYRVPRGYRYIIYYPYQANMTFNFIKDLTYTVESNQNASTPTQSNSWQDGLSAFEASDLLWDVAIDEQIEGSDGEKVNYANVKMDHVMAQIILNVDENMIEAANAGGYEVYIINNALTARNINLSTSTLEGMNYTPDTSTSDATIRMWHNGYATSGALKFRAVIPACTTLNGGTSIFKLRMADGTEKEFAIQQDLELNPGKNYIFNIHENSGTNQPELNDDDSWVLDVLDPETGAPVGLLCREYIRYQENNITDLHTGTDNGNGSKWINSQAWVFYNLQSDGRTPNLNQGTVLRFIYDIDPLSYDDQSGDYDSKQPISIWPAPHIEMKSYGLFTPKHGFQWGTQSTEGYGGEFTGYSFQETNQNAQPIEEQYYMHGGSIIWDGNENKIANFIMPTEQITNSQAYQGYIAIEEGKTPYVAYEEKENVKKGIIMEHYLIDTRYNREKHETETKRYPLVKIGYNQFWMSKPLDTSYLIDGTRIPCYNKKNETGVTFSVDENDQIFLSMGYMYPFVQNDENLKEVNDDYVYYDPYNNPGDRPSTSSSYQVCKHYNRAAIEDPRFVPISQESNNYYTMPSKTDLEYMREYFGPRFAAKICTRETVTFDATKTNAGLGTRFTTTRKKAIIEGKTCGNTSHDPQVYCANISGFNIRAIGFYDSKRHKQSFYDVGEAACLILKREPGQNGITLMRFAVYHSFDIGTNVFNEFEDAHSQNEFTYFLATKVFAQVRMFMKYRNQADTGGVSITTSTRSVSGSAPAESRNVYIPIQAID